MRVAFTTTLLMASLFLAAVAAGPQEGQEAEEPRQEKKAAEAVQEEGGYDQEEGRYGDAPKEFVPYHRTRKCYWRYFGDPTVFRGAGRDRPEPTGLESVKIGLIAPVEEGAVDLEIGRMVQRGVTLAFDEANASGGYKGKVPYEIVVRNDSGLWGASSNTAVDLAYGEKVWAMIGSVDGANSHIALRVVLKAEVMMVNTSCTDPTLTETAIPWLIRTYPDDRQYGYRLAWHVFNERGHEKVAVMRSNDKYGRMGIAEFRDSARRLGHPLVLEVRYVPKGKEGFDAQIERIRASGADAIVLWGGAHEAGRITAAVRAAGLTQPIYGSERLVSPTFLAAAGEAAEGVTAPYPIDLDRKDEAWTGFEKKFVDRFGAKPDAFATFSYDGARMLIGAIEEVGLNRARIRDVLCDLRSYEGVAGAMRFDPRHDNLGRLYLYQVRDGRFEKLEGK